jgi:hypothetical protein
MHYVKRVTDIAFTVTALGAGASFFWLLAVLINRGVTRFDPPITTGDQVLLGVTQLVGYIGSLTTEICAALCGVLSFVFLCTGSGILFHETESGQLVFRFNGVLQKLKQKRPAAA